MSLILGLDAGGTYTDSVIFDSKTKKIISEGKSLTTNFDLSIGVKKSIEISLNKIPIKNQNNHGGLAALGTSCVPNLFLFCTDYLF